MLHSVKILLQIHDQNCPWASTCFSTPVPVTPNLARRELPTKDCLFSIFFQFKAAKGTDRGAKSDPQFDARSTNQTNALCQYSAVAESTMGQNGTTGVMQQSLCHANPRHTESPRLVSFKICVPLCQYPAMGEKKSLE